MKFLKATVDNVFTGAVVMKNNIPYNVFKVNDKSLYLSQKPFKEFEEKLANKNPGITLTKLLESFNCIKSTYATVTISELEIAKKENFLIKQEIKNSIKAPLDSNGIKELVKLYKMAMSNKNFRYPVFLGNKTIIAISVNKEKEEMLLKVNEDWFFYLFSSGVFLPFEKEQHYNKPNINWPDFETYKAKKVA